MPWWTSRPPRRWDTWTVSLAASSCRLGHPTFPPSPALRYLILFPIRLVALAVAWILFLPIFFTVEFAMPTGPRKQKIQRALVQVGGERIRAALVQVGGERIRAALEQVGGERAAMLAQGADASGCC